MKFKVWNKEDLIGQWEIYLKIDGVRCHNINGEYISRNGKQLYNIPKLNFEVAEIFCGSFKSTIENTRTFKKEMFIKDEEVFELLPNIDERLKIDSVSNPTKELIQSIFDKYHNLGHEGLILFNGTKRLKVKNEETFDIKILDIFEGKGKNINKLGGFVTKMGNVGTGLNDRDRIKFYSKDMVGQIIEVKCMEITPDGKFRHPVFLRLREDK